MEEFEILRHSAFQPKNGGEKLELRNQCVKKVIIANICSRCTVLPRGNFGKLLVLNQIERLTKFSNGFIV